MQTDDLIAVEAFCSYYQAEASFINYLHEYGLIEITLVEQTNCIPREQLTKLEQLVRLHYDLDINLEGIEAITHLLNRVKSLQLEISTLKNRLRLYESP